MTRQARCSNCNKWFYNHNGQMIVLPDTYDDSKCPACNQEIAEQIKGDEEFDDFIRKSKP